MTPAPPTTGLGPQLYVNAATGTNTVSHARPNDCRDIHRPCRTIRHAIRVAPTTARIHVHAGNYPEQLTINSKNLTITGAGHGHTVIDPTSLKRNDPIGRTEAVVDFNHTTSGDLTGVSIDGTQAGAVRCPEGVITTDADIKLSYDRIAVTDVANASTCEYGVVGYDKTRTPTTLSVSRVSVSDYGLDGIYCGGQAQSCTITHSVITGYGPIGTVAQYGVEVNRTLSTSLTYTRVSDDSFTSPQFTGSNYADIGYGAGLGAERAGQLTVTHDTLIHNDADLVSVESQAASTITDNRFAGATNDTGTAPGSAVVPPGYFVGVGLSLARVADATVQGDTITSNADNGVNLGGVTDSTIGGPNPGQPDVISHNGNYGLGLDLADGVETSADTITDNVIDDNQGDGILAAGGSQQGRNAFVGNRIDGNAKTDAVDESTGAGTAGTANTWTGNRCATSSPAGLCSTGG